MKKLVKETIEKRLRILSSHNHLELGGKGLRYMEIGFNLFIHYNNSKNLFIIYYSQ